MSYYDEFGNIRYSQEELESMKEYDYFGYMRYMAEEMDRRAAEKRKRQSGYYDDNYIDADYVEIDGDYNNTSNSYHSSRNNNYGGNEGYSKQQNRTRNYDQQYSYQGAGSSFRGKKQSSSTTINNLQTEMEELGYYPTREITLETQLNLNKISKPKIGQKIHAFCLSGPPGAGKSFYVESYMKLIKRRMRNQAQIISYQCHTKTSDANLYEDINIAAAIKGDSDKVIISGKLVQAIDLANSGNIVILFLDEYDKAGEEVDTFLLNFLQDGVVDTTQRGKVVLKEECMQNLQVFLCKNNARESLSGPLTRRLKFLELDYMTPEILCKTIDRKLGHIDTSLRNAVTLLYTAMYQTLPEHNPSGNASEFEFSRLPAASECMQAVEDAWELIEIGADQPDIVLNGIVANMVKTKDDLEQFKELTKSNSELVSWYNNLMEAIGSNNQDYIEDVKQQMARQFFPEQIRRATRDIEEEAKRRRDELESEYKAQQQELQRKIDDAKSQLKEYEIKLKKLNKREKELNEQEKLLQAQSKEVQRLRENAQSDAKEVVDRYLSEKEKELNLFREETEKLRANADKDALEKAKIELADERKKLEDDIRAEKTRLQEFVETQTKEINQKIVDVNQQIMGHNIQASDIHGQKETIKMYEQELLSQKKIIEKLLGRPVTEEDLLAEDQEDVTISVGNNGEFKQTSDRDEEIQNNVIFNRNGSVFDNAKDGIWVDIGEITLETHSNKNMIFNGEFLKNLIEGYEATGMYKDGIMLHNGDKIKLIAVRVIQEEKKDGKSTFKNKFKFYANSTIVPKYAILDLCHFIQFIMPGGKYIPASITVDGKDKKISFAKMINAKINCMIYSDENYDEVNRNGCSISKQDEGEYLFSYQNTTHKQLSEIAKDIFNITKCSRKNVSSNIIQKAEQMAYILHSRNLGAQGLIETVDEVEI